MSDRDRFEAFAAKCGYIHPAINASGEYCKATVELMWRAWQAAIAAVPQPECVRVCVSPRDCARDERCLLKNPAQ